MRLFREYVGAEAPSREGQLTFLSKSFTRPPGRGSELVDVEDVRSGWYLTWLVNDDYKPGFK